MQIELSLNLYAFFWSRYESERSAETSRDNNSFDFMESLKYNGIDNIDKKRMVQINH